MRRLKSASVWIGAMLLGAALTWAAPPLFESAQDWWWQFQLQQLQQAPLRRTADQLDGFAAGLRPAQQTVTVSPSSDGKYHATFSLWLRNPGNQPIELSITDIDDVVTAATLEPSGRVPAGYESLVQISMRTEQPGPRDVTLYLRARKQTETRTSTSVALDLPLRLRLQNP